MSDRIFPQVGEGGNDAPRESTKTVARDDFVYQTKQISLP